MEIAFVMASVGICGGNKYIFEVANRMAEKGHKIYIVHDEEPDWMKVNAEFVSEIPDCDVTVATYWTTAPKVWREGKGEKFYLVQNYEAWFPNQPIRKVEDTYRLPFKMIVDCEWLKNYLEMRFNAEVLAVAHGGVDHSLFKPDKPVTKKRVLAVSRPFDPRRDMATTFEAFKIVKQIIPDVEFVMYGAEKPPDLGFPIEFHHAPSYKELAEIYRSCRVFVSSSLLEGCPLCHLEALASGCPVVTTPAGVEDYGVNRENMIIVPPKRPQALADAICDILKDDDLYMRLRENGIRASLNFSWEKTTNIILNAFLGIIPKGEVLERIIPELVPKEMYEEHMDRYRFAEDYVKGKTVLDVGCGVGYGTYHLSKYAKRIIGVDKSEEAIKYAKEHYKAENLSFIVGNCTHLPILDSESFDVIVSFEVIEHVRNYIAYLSEVSRLLRKDGVFICSTPDKNRFAVKDPYHIKEFTFEEFKETLRKFFSQVLIFYQEKKPFMIAICKGKKTAT